MVDLKFLVQYQTKFAVWNSNNAVSFDRQHFVKMKKLFTHYIVDYVPQNPEAFMETKNQAELLLMIVFDVQTSFLSKLVL